MTSKRERALQLAAEILALKARLRALEAEFDSLIDDGESAKQKNAEVAETKQTAAVMAATAESLKARPRVPLYVRTSAPLRLRVRTLLKQRGNIPLDVKELAAALSTDIPTMRTTVWRLHQAGDLIKEEGGYRLRETDEPRQPVGKEAPEGE